MARPSIGTAPEGRGFLAVARVLALFVFAFAVLIFLLYQSYVEVTDLDPDEVEVPEYELEVNETGRSVAWGRSELSRKGRLWQLRLVGSPTEMGAAHGRLGGRLFRRIDDHVNELLDQRYGSWTESWAERMLLRWDYRGADEHIDAETKTELSALASVLPERDGELNAYHRLFLYQAMFDISQRIEDTVMDGTMFAVASKASSKEGGEPGNLMIGRSLTVDFGQDFEPDRIVSLYYPDGKYPFASIGWAGMTGVVTGINARGVFVAVNPARTDDPREDEARPLPLVVRRVLEEADSMDRAVEMLMEAQYRTAGIALVGDGTQRKAVVLELSARAKEETRLIRGEDEPVVWATDHMVRDVFERDAQNDRVRRTTSSGYRYDRLGELLGDISEMDAEGVVAVLRDRQGHDNAELGLGNRSAIENLVGTHSVVIDATAMVLWVCEGPSALGRYRAFDLRFLLGRQGDRPAPLEDLSADRLLHSEEFNDYKTALEEIEYARYLYRLDRFDEALASARIALALAPDVGELHRLLGDIERELEHNEAARKHYERYLQLVPGRRRDQERVRGIIDELSG